MADDKPLDEQSHDKPDEDVLPPLEQWPEDEGGAPHSRPDPVSIPKLLLRALPRVALAVLLAFLYSASEGATALAFLLSWLVVVGSMLTPRWRRYVETGQKGRPAPSEPLIVPEEPKPATPSPLPAAGGDEEGEDGEPLDPRDAWDLPDELPGEKTDEKPGEK